jgi:deoxyribonuclease V
VTRAVSASSSSDSSPSRTRFAAVDVYYPETGGAVAALVVADGSTFGQVIEEHTAVLDKVADYRPGEFFARELPAIGAVLARTAPIDLLVVDGYVDLDPDGKPGLGAHAHTEFAVPVIGVAKTAFHSASHAIGVQRGETAQRPLYVTAVGLPLPDAAELVRRMAGRYRMPDALRRVDTLSRSLPGSQE